jgi:acetyl-CoA acyltransferase
MGLTAERVAAKYQITREDSDRFSVGSHEKALRAIASRRFDAETLPVPVASVKPGGPDPDVEETTLFTTDEGPRSDTSLEALARLRPVFHAKGLVTAGNSSQTSDGAAATVVMSLERAREWRLKPLARVVSYAYAGCDPEEMGIGPVRAVPKALAMAGLRLNDIGLIELNEAFAAQSLAVIRELELDPAKVNVNGGAIALGHPLGCTGTKLTATLIQEMRRRGLKYGIVTMCVGGGMGAAGIFENLQN